MQYFGGSRSFRAAGYTTVIAAALTAMSACATPYELCDTRLANIDVWERQMRDRGRFWGEYFDPDNSIAPSAKRVNEFYDSANTFFNISTYLNEEEPWHTYAQWALSVYRDTYLIPNGWKAAGWRRSSYGLYQDFLRGGATKLEDLVAMRDKPAFSRVREGRGQGGAEHRSREVALAVESNIIAERAGAERVMEGGRPRLKAFVGWMASHLYEWRTAAYGGDTDTFGKPRFAPFMFGITAHALIQFVEWERERGANPDEYWPQVYPVKYGPNAVSGPTVDWPNAVSALSDVALWAVSSARHVSGESMWTVDDFGNSGFLYESINAPKRAFDLNMMIAHVYAWLWKETGNPKFREIGDRLFSSGAINGSTVTGKHFNQQYMMAFDFIKWRSEGDALHCVGAKSVAPKF